jgi:hypothetical protein
MLGGRKEPELCARASELAVGAINLDDTTFFRAS